MAPAAFETTSLLPACCSAGGCPQEPLRPPGVPSHCRREMLRFAAGRAALLVLHHGPACSDTFHAETGLRGPGAAVTVARSTVVVAATAHECQGGELRVWPPALVCIEQLWQSLAVHNLSEQTAAPALTNTAMSLLLQLM
jgi:hypothetical protein